MTNRRVYDQTPALGTFFLLLAMSNFAATSGPPESELAQLPPRAAADKRPRARDLGIPFEGTPGPHNAITDVGGVEVGHATLISGEGKLEVGKGPVRTGVTAILPRGKDANRTGLRGNFFA